MVSHKQFPAFEKLGGGDIPTGASWGLFGPGDELGTLNFIDEECVRRAAGLVKKGEVFPLGLGQNFFDPPLAPGRKSAGHTVFQNDYGFDDKYDDFYPQASSQWDALRHVRHPKLGFYNGHPKDSVTHDNDVLSISRIARRGVATRGVLIDAGRLRERWGDPIDFTADGTISVADLERALKETNIELRAGDMLLVRTGWLAYMKDRLAEGGDPPEGPKLKIPGLANDVSMPAFLWNNRVASVVADNYAVEASPGPGGRSLHVQLIAFLGMPIGELWDLDALAADCAEDGVYECLLSSAPLDLPGGGGSPAAALAIK